MDQSVKRPTLAILIAITAIGPLALNIFIPSMPGIQAVFATDYGTVQLTLTLYLVGTAISQLFLGSLSDRFGRRPVLLAGLILFLVGSIAAAAAASITMLIFSRVIQAVGGCAGLVLGRAIVRDLYDQETAASKIAYVTMAMVVAPMLAPAVGGYLDVWFGWRASFIAVAIVGAVVLALSVVSLHETHHRLQPLSGLMGIASGYGTLLRSSVFRGYALNSAFSSAMFFSFLAGAPYIMVELLGRSPGEYGLYFILISLGYMGGNFISGRLSRRVGTNRMIGLGIGLAFIGAFTLLGLALAGVFSPMAIFGPMLIIAVANGVSLPNSTASAISVRPQITGAASGLAGFLQIAVGALATFIVGALQDDTQFPMIFTMFASAWIAFGSFIVALLAQR